MGFNDKMNWSDHIINTPNSLIIQLKRRKNAIYMASKFLSPKFLANYANAILMSKINYHLEVWGNCTKTQALLINKIIMSTARHITQNKYGRTDFFVLNSLKWHKIEEMYKLAVCKITHKFLNTMSNPHYLTAEIRKDRSIRMAAENKLGPKRPIRRGDQWTLKTFKHAAKSFYNYIPKEITLIIPQKLFKKWIKLYINDPNCIRKVRAIKYWTTIHDDTVDQECEEETTANNTNTHHGQ